MSLKKELEKLSDENYELKLKLENYTKVLSNFSEELKKLKENLIKKDNEIDILKMKLNTTNINLGDLGVGVEFGNLKKRDVNNFLIFLRNNNIISDEDIRYFKMYLSNILLIKYWEEIKSLCLKKTMEISENNEKKNEEELIKIMIDLIRSNFSNKYIDDILSLIKIYKNITNDFLVILSDEIKKLIEKTIIVFGLINVSKTRFELITPKDEDVFNPELSEHQFQFEYEILIKKLISPGLRIQMGHVLNKANVETYLFKEN